MAFQDYKPKDGLFGSKFVGLEKFKFLFSDDVFLRDIRNTLAMGVLNLVTTFLMAIIFAILLNEVRNMFGKKLVQTVSYLPHFLSWIVVTGILHDALSSTGIINEMLVNLGILNSPINFFANPGYFWPIVAFANIHDQQNHNGGLDARKRDVPDFAPPAGTIQSGCLIQAGIDGGNGGQVDNGIPAGFLPNIGKCNDWPKITRIGEEVDGRIQNAQVHQHLIDIYTLTWGISQNDYSLGTAAGIFKSVVAIILILGANRIQRNGDEQNQENGIAGNKDFVHGG